MYTHKHVTGCSSGDDESYVYDAVEIAGKLVIFRPKLSVKGKLSLMKFKTRTVSKINRCKKLLAQQSMILGRGTLIIIVVLILSQCARTLYPL